MEFCVVSLESRQRGSPEEIIAFSVIPSICLFQQIEMPAQVETFFNRVRLVLSLSAPRDDSLTPAGGLLKGVSS